MDWASWRRQRVLRDSRRGQFDATNGAIRSSSRLLHPNHQPRDRDPRYILRGRRKERWGLPRHPARCRGHVALRAKSRGGTRLVSTRVPAVRRAVVADRSAVHNPHPLRIPGSPGGPPDRICRESRHSFGHLLCGHFLRDTIRHVPVRLRLQPWDDAELHSRQQQFRTRDCRSCRDFRPA